METVFLGISLACLILSFYFQWQAILAGREDRKAKAARDALVTRLMSEQSSAFASDLKRGNS